MSGHEEWYRRYHKHNLDKKQLKRIKTHADDSADTNRQLKRPQIVPCALSMYQKKRAGISLPSIRWTKTDMELYNPG